MQQVGCKYCICNIGAWKMSNIRRCRSYLLVRVCKVQWWVIKYFWLFWLPIQICRTWKCSNAWDLEWPLGHCSVSFCSEVLVLVQATNRKLFFSLVCAGIFYATGNSVVVFICLCLALFKMCINVHSVHQRKIPKYISHTWNKCH